MIAAPRLPGGAHRRGDPHLRRDEAAQSDRDCMGREPGIRVVAGDLEAWHEEEAVERARPLGLLLDRSQVGRMVPCVHVPGLGALSREPRVPVRERVVAQAEEVEAGVSVDIDELPEGERPVAPGRVCVQLAEEHDPKSGDARARGGAPGGEEREKKQPPPAAERETGGPACAGPPAG